jgi:hypothetical protein
VLGSRQRQTLGKYCLCRVLPTRQNTALGKDCQGVNDIQRRALCQLPRHSAKVFLVLATKFLVKLYYSTINHMLNFGTLSLLFVIFL